MKELDVVKLKDGRKATILEVYDEGKVFLVEISDDTGRTLEMPVIRENEIEQVIWRC